MANAALIIPFPSERRRSFIRRQAVRMASLSTAAAEQHLAEQLRVQARTMRRKGIVDDRIEHELRHLETAIRLDAARANRTSGGVL